MAAGWAENLFPELIEEKDLTPTLLAETVKTYLYDEEKINSVKKNVKAFADKECLDKITAVVKQLTGK